MEEKCMGLKNEVALQEKQTGDVDRQLDETTRELHREREKLMAVIRMSGDLIFGRSRRGIQISCSKKPGTGQKR